MMIINMFGLFAACICNYRRRADS